MLSHRWKVYSIPLPNRQRLMNQYPVTAWIKKANKQKCMCCDTGVFTWRQIINGKGRLNPSLNRFWSIFFYVIFVYSSFNLTIIVIFAGFLFAFLRPHFTVLAVYRIFSSQQQKLFTDIEICAVLMCEKRFNVKWPLRCGVTFSETLVMNKFSMHCQHSWPRLLRLVLHSL